MLAIRMQRTGRKGHASFRMVVQDSRQSPKSGKVVAQLGSYDPHTKAVTLAKDKAEFYLKNGARPSERIAGLFKQEGVKLPVWAVADTKKQGTIRNPEKLRKNRAPEPKTSDTTPSPSVVEEPTDNESDQAKPSTSSEADSAVAANEAESSSIETKEKVIETPAVEEPAEETPAAEEASSTEPADEAPVEVTEGKVPEAIQEIPAESTESSK